MTNLNETKEINIGTKLNLNLNGKERLFKVTEVRGDEYRLFNKFVISFWCTEEEILKNLVA
jgi:hypothetical protein